jgi:hypothetical protein
MCNLVKAAALLFAALCIPSANAQDAGTAVGDYCLAGVREVGSCIRLSAGGRFEYFLAYGAYDENAQGTWRLDGGIVVLDTPPYDKRPTFSFKRMQRGETDAFDVVVQNAAGRNLSGIEVAVTCDGRTRRAGVTSGVDFKIDCTSAPTEVLLGLRMYGLAPQTIRVGDSHSADKTYVFEFDPGDLGRKKFAGERLRFKTSDVLVMTFRGSPIAELDGTLFEYVRSHSR